MTHMPTDSQPPRRATFPWRLLAIVALALAALPAGVVGVLHTPWGMKTIANVVLEAADPWPGSTLSARAARGGFLSQIELYGIRLQGARGSLSAELDTLRITYLLHELLGRPQRVREVVFAGVRLTASGLPERGRKAPPRSRAKPGDFALDRFELHRGEAEVHIASLGRDSVLFARNLALTLTGVRLRESASLALAHLTATLVSPAAPPESLRLALRARLDAGRLEIDTLSVVGRRTQIAGGGTLPVSRTDFEGTDFHLNALPLARHDIQRFLPFLGDPGDVTLGVVARSEGPSLLATVDARAQRGGRVTVRAQLPSASGPLSLKTQGRVDNLDLGSLRGGRRDSLVIDAAWRAELAGPDRAHLSGPFALNLDGTRIGDLKINEARLEGALDRGRATVNARARAEGYALTGEGWATPFDSLIAYEGSAVLSVTRVGFPPASPFTSPPETTAAAKPTLFAGDIHVRVQGRGVTAQRANATASLELHPEPGQPSLLGAGQIDTGLDAGVTRWRLDLGVASGSVRADGELRLTEEPAYRVRRAAVAGVDVAAFAGDTIPSRLDAVLHAEGRGLEPDRMRASAVIDSLLLVYGMHRIEGHGTTLRVERGRAQLASSATVDRAAVDARASLEPLSRPRAATLAVDVQGLDLAQVTGDTALVSQIGGRLTAELRGTDLRAWLSRTKRPEAIAAGRGFAQLELSPSIVRDQRISTLDLRGDLERGQVTLGGRLQSSFGTARLAGTARPFDANPTLRIEPLAFSSLSPLLVLGRRDAEIVLNGALTGEMSGRDLEQLAGNVDLDLGGSRVNQVTFDQLSMHSRLEGGQLEGAFTARAGRDSADVAFRGTPFEEMRRLKANGRIRSVGFAGLLGIDSVQAGGVLAFSVDGSQPRGGSVDDLELAGALDGKAWFGEARLDTVASEFRIENGVAHVPRLALRGNVVAADGGGRVALPGSATRDSTNFHFDGTLDRLDLLPTMPGIRDLAGSGRIHLAAWGPSGATALRGDVAIMRPHFNEIWADSAQIHVTGMLRDTVFDRLDATIRAQRLVVWPLRSRDLEATTTWDGQVLVAEVRSLIEDQRTDHFVVRLEPVAGGVRGRLETFEMDRRGLDIALEKPAAFEFSRITRIDDLVLLESGVPRLRANGGIDSAGIANFRVQVDSLDLADYLDLAGLPALGGRLTLDGSVTGHRERPILAATMRAQLVSGKGKPAWVTGRLAWAESAFDLNAAFEQSADHRIALESHLPLALTLAPARGQPFVTLIEAPMSGHLTAERFDFSWFEPLISPRVVRRPRGWLDGDVRLEGKPASPQVSGSLALSDAQVELPRLGVLYQRGEAQLSFAGRTITLDRAALSSGGRAEATGSLTFHGRSRRTVDLTLTLDRFIPMNTLEVKATLSGEATLAGDLAAPRLRGKLVVHHTTAYLEAGGEGAVESVELSPRDRLDLRERFGVGSSRAARSGPSFADSVDADVTITVGDNVWVRRRSDPIVALELEGDVHARKPPAGKLDARGTLGIRTGRSYMSFVGRRFDLTHAEIGLPGPVDSASVRIEAFYSPSASGSTSADVDVTAVVTIDASGVETELRSEPYLDHSALIGYLATGQVEGEMESGTAYGLAVGSALGAVGGVAGRSLGLDVVQVTMDANGGQTLSAGSYVDPRIYLGFRQPVIQDQNRGTNSTSGSTPTEFEVEFEARRNLLFNIQGSSAQYRFLLRPRLGR